MPAVTVRELAAVTVSDVAGGGPVLSDVYEALYPPVYGWVDQVSVRVRERASVTVSEAASVTVRERVSATVREP